MKIQSFLQYLLLPFCLLVSLQASEDQLVNSVPTYEESSNQLSSLVDTKTEKRLYCKKHFEEYKQICKKLKDNTLINKEQQLAKVSEEVKICIDCTNYQELIFQIKKCNELKSKLDFASSTVGVLSATMIFFILRYLYTYYLEERIIGSIMNEPYSDYTTYDREDL